ncbi:MAG: PilZ domain-containing protein [Acidobacteria bacterium]|uniref:PilZ domain-containing protein n=1 Tax=Candidatus Polarisedimenticola svalbardensis TaxID=2886004 RepID=A0A8J6XXC6_9BACT|nr:PilZ domain-containing protein [Candidatus Polarisedimenticola svalbardensis]
MSDPNSERRAHERIDHTLEFEGFHSDQKAVARMVASNLSVGGVYCTSCTDFPEMTRLGVRMSLPHNGNLEVEAVVVRRRELPSPSGGDDRFELALFFTSITAEQKEMLTGYLQATTAPPKLDN